MTMLERQRRRLRAAKEIVRQADVDRELRRLRLRAARMRMALVVIRDEASKYDSAFALRMGVVASRALEDEDCRCAGPNYHPDKECPVHPKLGRR